MLLLVVQSQHGYVAHVIRHVFVQQGEHLFVDVPSVLKHPFDRRAGKQPALPSRLSISDGVVVRIEQITELRVKRTVARSIGFQHEGLKEPRRVRQMPLGRADVFHRLHDIVFDLQRLAQPLCLLTDLQKILSQLTDRWDWRCD